MPLGSNLQSMFLIELIVMHTDLISAIAKQLT